MRNEECTMHNYMSNYTAIICCWGGYLMSDSKSGEPNCSFNGKLMAINGDIYNA